MFCFRYVRTVPSDHTMCPQYWISNFAAWTETEAHADDSDNANKNPSIDFELRIEILNLIMCFS